MDEVMDVWLFYEPIGCEMMIVEYLLRMGDDFSCKFYYYDYDIILSHNDDSLVMKGLSYPRPYGILTLLYKGINPRNLYKDLMFKKLNEISKIQFSLAPREIYDERCPFKREKACSQTFSWDGDYNVN